MITLEELYNRIIEEKEERKKENERKKKEKISNKEIILETKEKDNLDNKTELMILSGDDVVKSTMLDRWKPFSIENYVLPKFKIPFKNSNNTEKATIGHLRQILAFVEYVQKIRFKNGCTIIPIPTTSNRNLMIWGYPMAITRGKKLMEEMGLITVYDNSFRFCAYEGGSYGKLYAYYEENERKLIQYCKENGIYKHVVKNTREFNDEGEAEKFEITFDSVESSKTFDVSEVRFGKGLTLEKPKGVSFADFDDYLTCCLYKNYPELEFHQMKADEINERFYKDYPEFKLRFRPHFTWKKNTVVRIGIRLTNEFCNKTKEERKELLDKYGFRLAKDVKSSVPRLTLSINKGEWIDEDIDIYELINNEFDPGSEFTKERRDAIKHFMLTTYFEEGSNKWLGKNITYKLKKRDFDKKEVDELLGHLRDSARKVLGGTFGSDIFYIESCVYLMSLYDLLTSGHMVWLVYDAFYSTGENDEETFESMLREGIRLNFNNFMDISSIGGNSDKWKTGEKLEKKLWEF